MIQPQKEQPLKAYSKASLKSYEGKERKKRKDQVQNQITLYCLAWSEKIVRLLQNTTKHKGIELIISSHGQYTQTQHSAKVLGYLPYI